MRRLTETDKWSDSWHFRLSPDAKLFLFYIRDNCDCAGFWEVNPSKAEFDIGWPKSKLDVDAMLAEFNDEHLVDVGAEPQIIVLPKFNKWWMPKYIPFQYFYKGWNPGGCKAGIIWSNEPKKMSPMHRSVVLTLSKYGMLGWFINKFPNSIRGDVGELAGDAMSIDPEKEEQGPFAVGKFIQHAIKEQVTTNIEAVVHFHNYWTGRNWTIEGDFMDTIERRLAFMRSYFQQKKRQLEEGRAKETAHNTKLRIQACENEIERLKLDIVRGHDGVTRMRPGNDAKIADMRQQIQEHEVKLRGGK